MYGIVLSYLNNISLDNLITIKTTHYFKQAYFNIFYIQKSWIKIYLM